MHFILGVLKSMRWFFISTFIVLMIAIGLSHLTLYSLGQNTLYDFVMKHPYFWGMIRGFIIVGFILIWPCLVRHWAKRHSWEKAYALNIVRQRWRFAAWLVLVDLTFQLL